MDNPPFVGRQQEIERLHGYLARAAGGQGQLCFVTGEAGSGKTTLVDEFVRQAQAGQPRLLAAVGRCDAHTGAGDAYLPFREIIGLLTGTVEPGQGRTSRENATRLGSAFRVVIDLLVEIGPDLVGTILPPIKLATKAGLYIAEKAGWVDKLKLRMPGKPGAGKAELDQNHLFEQYTNVMKKLSEKHPLIVVVDDLQWVDDASSNLLFRLSRRLEESPILLIGAYRPEEVSLGRVGGAHPLEKVLVELKRYQGDIWIDLERPAAEGRAFVDALLDAAPNRLDESFRQALCQHTGGHPLFVAEMLRTLQERGDLAEGAQGWEPARRIDWDRLPTRVEGVLQERLHRLDDTARRVLTVASVQGETFTAEVVAHLQSTTERETVQLLSEQLVGQHRLIQSAGLERRRLVRLSRFRFRHALLQEHLYHSLGEAERSYLHEDTARALEALYGEGADEIAVQLAWHYEQAQDMERAQHYLRRAGELAAATYANVEALGYLGRALELTPPEDGPARYDLLRVREAVLDRLGQRDAQRQDLQSMEGLAQALGDPARQAEVALRQGNLAEATGGYAAAITADREAVRLARSAAAGAAEGEAVSPAQPTPGLRHEISGHLQWGRALYRQGDYPAAEAHLGQALEMSRGAGETAWEAAALLNLGIVALTRGNGPEAERCLQGAQELYRRLDDRLGAGKALNNLGNLYAGENDLARARPCYEQALETFRQAGWRLGESTALTNLGIVLDGLGDYPGAAGAHQESLRICRQIGNRMSEGHALNNLAFVLLSLGLCAQARARVEESLQICRELGSRRDEGLALSNLGLIAHRLGENGLAARCAAQARQMARELGDGPTEAGALTHLGHALSDLGRPEEAAAAYRQALEIARELEEPALSIEALAGLARLALAQGEAARAQALGEEVLAFLEQHTLDGTEEPFRIYLTCWQSLRAGESAARARALLRVAHGLLLERAGRMGDEALRRSFLEGVPAHREIEAEYRRL